MIFCEEIQLFSQMHQKKGENTKYYQKNNSKIDK